MAPASLSKPAAISESACTPRTPNSERSWRHWPSLHGSNHQSPVTSSEGRPSFWGSFRLRRRANEHSIDGNGSPTRRGRRTTVTDFLAGLGSPKKQREHNWSISGKATKSKTVSLLKKDDRIGERPSQPKRRKSISDLFGSTRGHSSTPIPPKIQIPSKIPDVPVFQDKLNVKVSNVPANVENTGDKPSVVERVNRAPAKEEEAADKPFEVETVNEMPVNEEDDDDKANVVETTTAVRPSPTRHVRFANSDEGEDSFAERPEQTRVIREIKQPEEQRRVCSASSETSNAPTLVAEDQSIVIQPEKEADRPRTPDSYLQMLIEACESSGGSSATQEHHSPSPSPAKCNAVQPLDFLADKCTPPMNDRDCSDPDPLNAELSPLTGMDPVTKRRVGLKRQDRTTRRRPVLWIDSEELVIRTQAHDKAQVLNVDSVDLIRNSSETQLSSNDAADAILNDGYVDFNLSGSLLEYIQRRHRERDENFDTLEPLVPFNDTIKLTWNVGDIDLYFRLIFQERNERFKNLEGGFGCLELEVPSADTTEPTWENGDIDLYLQLTLQDRTERFKSLEVGFDVFEPEIPSNDSTELKWNVGDVRSNLERGLQERVERYSRLEDRIYIARNIKMTVARMTRNFHSNRSSEEDHGLPSSSQAIIPQQTISVNDHTETQLSLSCQFEMDSEDALDSVNRGSQILREVQNKVISPTSSLKSIPSPDIKPRRDSAIERALADTVKLRTNYESVDHQVEVDLWKVPQNPTDQGNCNVEQISEMTSCNEEVKLDYLQTFATSSKCQIAVPADYVAIRCKQSDEPVGTENIGEDDILLSMICGNRKILERNPAPAALEAEAETEIRTTGRSRKMACKTVSYDDAEFYRSSEEWKEESLDMLWSLWEPRPLHVAQPPEVPISKRNQDFEPFPPTYIVEDVLKDSRALRTFGGHASFSSFRTGGASTSSKMSSLARRRVVSTAAVQVQFPATKNSAPRIETFDSRIKAIAGLYLYKLSQLSNNVVYDPAKRIFYAQDPEYVPPSLAKLQERRLELVWLPLQPNSLPPAMGTDSHEDGQPSSSTQENEMKKPVATKENENTASLYSQFTAHDSLVDNSDPSASDSGIGNENLSRIQPNTGLTVDLVDNLPDVLTSQSQEDGWTLSDEEYVVEVEPDTAREYLGSDYAESICPTPELRKGTFLYPRILLNGEDSLYDSDDSFDLRNTPTWPQLGREFKANHPKLFPRPGPERSPFEDKSESSFSDVDFESSSSGDSDSSAWSSQVRNSYCLVRDGPRRLNESFETGIRATGSNPSYDLAIAEHVENIESDVDENTLARTPNNTDNTDSVRDDDQHPELGIRVTCDHPQCSTENGESSSRPGSIAFWRSWVEADLAQSSLFQPLPWLPQQDPEDSAGKKSTFSSQSTQILPSEPRNQLQPKRLDKLQKDDPSDSISGSVSRRGRSSSARSFAAGFRFTAFSEHMMEENEPPVKSSLESDGGEHMLEQHERPVESSLTSNDSEDSLAIASQSEVHSRTSQEIQDPDGIPDMPATKTRGFLSRQTDLSGDLAGKQKAVIINNEIAENSVILEAVNIGALQAESAIAPEDLNIRLVGKAARQSQLAKTSKVGALIDVYKAFGVMPQTLKPALHRTQTPPAVDRQSSGRPGGLSARIITPSGKIYGPCGMVRVSTAGPSNNSGPARRVPTPASVSGDVDTESDSAFGEDLGRVDRYDDGVSERKISGQHARQD
ncbi:uncharacterized protein PAC_09106 [Phialocephala subalpina]|uniref:Uncharacterized protein n=1 Tax=Phialocephala subalpina TaxID=576137 RepID=A0A1L7X2G3_9HELO|nr:uncharacterized protein PAC_09106 [Phialocephala subalpina]